MLTPWLFQGLLVPPGYAAWRWLERQPGVARAWVAGLAWFGLSLAAILPVCEVTGFDIFGPFSLLAWLCFLDTPLMLLLAAATLSGRARLGFVGLALAIGGLGLWMSCVEPFRLGVSTHRVPLQGLSEPLRVAVFSDLQTRRIGAYERRALRRLAELPMDLVLYPGDYVQSYEPEALQREREALREVLRAMPEPRLGAYAVQGDIDGQAWPEIFEGTGIHALGNDRVDLGPLVLTTLDRMASRSIQPPIEPADKPHLVVGHAPDFALSRPSADLLVAGHTHGGQIVIPGFGPLLTLSRVPRAWASGRTELPWGGTLVVSRGVGLERRHAPRLRLFCAPEIVVLHLVPKKSPPPTE